MPEPTFVTALGIEARALGGPTVVSGMGGRRARAVGERLAASLPASAPVAVVGVGAGIDPEVRAGQVVVADVVRALPDGEPVSLSGATLVARELARAGLPVSTGSVVTSERLMGRRRRSGLVGEGAVCLDMESAWLAAPLAGRPLVVVRVAADTATDGMVTGGFRALRALRGLRGPLETWAAALGPREVLLAAPRSFCAGVERAVDIVERALERFGLPVYVRRQIVHNSHVVAGLEARGAVFVEELDEVPEGATVVLAAHGVSPEVRSEAEERRLEVIDATCPLVAKVHHQAKRYAAQGRHLVLVGHGDHEEVVGTMGEVPDRMHLVERAEDVPKLPLGAETPVAYLTQTTLAVDETAGIVDALRGRFEDLVGPEAHDICYATQNRQDAVAEVATSCDLVLVVGSPNSSNTLRLVEVARRRGCRAELVEDETMLDLSWLAGAGVVGVTAGASAPESVVQGVVRSLGQLGPIEVREQRTNTETVHFSLPRQVR